MFTQKMNPKRTNRCSPNKSHTSIHTPKVQNTLRRFNLWLLLCECFSSRKCLNISAFSRPYAGPPRTTSAQNGALNAPPGAWPNLYHHGSHEPMTVSPQAAGNSRSQMSGASSSSKSVCVIGLSTSWTAVNILFLYKFYTILFCISSIRFYTKWSFWLILLSKSDHKIAKNHQESTH